MGVITLKNEYFCYCLLVGEVRFSRHRLAYERSRGSFIHRVIAPQNLSPQAHGVSKDEHRERVALLEQIYGIEAAQPGRWYHLPLYQIWKRMERAQKEGRRRVS